jgi:hypothetical protein
MAALNLPIRKAFNGASLLALIKELVRLDRHWIPQEDGHSLYIRPAMSAFSSVFFTVFAWYSLAWAPFFKLVPRIPSEFHPPNLRFSLLFAARLGRTIQTDSSPWLCMARRITCVHTLEVRSEDGPSYPLLGSLTDVVRYRCQARGHIKLVPTTRLESSHRSRRPSWVTSRISGYRGPNITSLRSVCTANPAHPSLCFVELKPLDDVRSAR